MITIELAELDRDVPVQLEPEQGRRLAASSVVTARPSPFEPDLWLVSPSGKVGTARIGDIQLQIRPKLPITRLLFLLGYVRSSDGWREDTIRLPEHADLVPAFAHSLWRQAEQALRQGLLQGYLPTDDTSMTLRGRLRETAQLHRQAGLPLPLEIRFDDFTTDIAENRILRTAVDRMLTVPKVDTDSLRMLRRTQRKLAEITPLVRGAPLPQWRPSRLNARYQDALRLAEIVLRATSLDQGTGSVTANGFLFDMPRVFEDFVTVALRERLEPVHGGRVAGQDHHHLDEAGLVVMRPDIVWYRSGAAVTVADAKYKADKLPNSDLYQMLAYCTAMGLPRGHLIYAHQTDQRGPHVLRGSGIEILCHGLSLDQEPAVLLASLDAVSEELTRPHRPQSRSPRHSGPPLQNIE